MTLGERIKMFREAAHLTQQRLADEIGVAKSTITGYEKGNREPDVDKIKKIARVVGVTGDELLGTEFAQKETPSWLGERQVNDEDIKFALFGGDGEITDEMYEEVKRFAEFVKNRKEHQ